MKGSLARVVDMFVCERAEDGEDSNIDESLDLGNGLHLENVRKFCTWGYAERGEAQIQHLRQQ